MTKDKALKKIRKCLALSQSGEPHEAAAALRQAQKLMEEFNLNDRDVELADVKESAASAGSRAETPSAWLTTLAHTVEEAFGVSSFYEVHLNRPSRFVFVGLDPANEIAQYTFAVLLRQCRAARSAYYKTRRGKRANRIARADAYAMGWVRAVERKVQEFAKPVPQIVGQYLTEKHNGLVTITPKSRTLADGHEHGVAGFIDGKNVELHHGMGADQRLALEAR